MSSCVLPQGQSPYSGAVGEAAGRVDMGLKILVQACRERPRVAQPHPWLWDAGLGLVCLGEQSGYETGMPGRQAGSLIHSPLVLVRKSVHLHARLLTLWLAFLSDRLLLELLSEYPRCAGEVSEAGEPARQLGLLALPRKPSTKMCHLPLVGSMEWLVPVDSAGES